MTLISQIYSKTSFKAKFTLNINRDETTEDVIYVEMNTPSIFERNRGAMCSFTVNNKMIMVGGDGFAYRNRHLEVIEETREIKELPELEIDFERTSCASIRSVLKNLTSNNL